MLELVKPAPGMYKEKSLIVFNLDWTRCDIGTQVSKASRSLNALAEAMGAGQKIVFNMALAGAGEFILNSTADKSPIPEEKLDVLRKAHTEIRKELDKTPAYVIFRDTLEMLTTLRGDDHTLAVIYNGATSKCEEALQRARLRDHFDDRVFGSDRTKNGKFDAFLYHKVLDDNNVRPAQAMLVEETPEGASYGSKTRAKVVALITDDNCAESEFYDRRVAMHEAGATHIAISRNQLTKLPHKIKSTQALHAILGLH